MAVNDSAERLFGSMTGQMKCFGHIGLCHAWDVGQVRINWYLSHGFDANSKNKTIQMGIFHKLSNRMHLSLITVSLEYSQVMYLSQINNKY